MEQHHHAYNDEQPGHLLRRARRQMLRRHFPAYLARSFAGLNPGQTLEANWHLDAIAEYLNALEAGQFQRLIINMPPRSLKSHTITVAWTAFLLGNDPARKIITASYSSALSLKHAMDARSLVQSPWHQYLFPELMIMPGQNEKARFVTTSHGFRLATSVGGTLTGEGGDLIIVDDPLKPAQAMSQHWRSRANHWFDHTLSSRLNDKRRGQMVVVMQRLHEEDLTSHLLRKGGWEHLCLPAQAQSSQTISTGRFHKVMEQGELLQPQREHEGVLEQMRTDLGSFAFAAQYLQEPVNTESGIIRADWLTRCRDWPLQWERVVQSWDTAIKTGDSHDYTACVMIGVSEGRYYVRDVLRFRADYPTLKRRIRDYYQRHDADVVLIEDKASGQSILQDLKRERGIPVVGITPKRDKLHRLARVSPLLEAGHIVFPMQAPWWDGFAAEIIGFPHSTHDDQVDAFSQGVDWLQRRDDSGGQQLRSL